MKLILFYGENKTKVKFGFLSPVCLLLALVFFMACTNVVHANDDDRTVIEYYYYSSCDSCTEGEYFENELKENLKDVIGEEEYIVQLKNVSIPEIYDEFVAITKDQQTEDFYPTPPLLKVGDTFLFGVDDITDKSRDTIVDEIKISGKSQDDLIADMKGIDPNDSFFVYFFVPGCKDCQKAQSYFEAMDKTYFTEGKDPSNLKINYINIGDFNNIPLAQWFYQKYHIEEKDQKAPALFYQNGCLQGFEEIKNGMPGVISRGEARNWQDVDYVPASVNEGFTMADWGMLVVTGLTNGLNPCGLSILFLLISLLLTKKEKIRRLGMAFILAKIVTYLLLGTVFSSILGQLSTTVIEPVQRVLKIVLVVFITIFAILNFVDIYFTSREKYGEVKMQLPAKLKRFNQKYLEKVLQRSSKSLVGVVFLAGIVISVGEFLCTGQLYLASVIYVMDKQGAFGWSAFLMFAVYLICMSIPLLIIVYAADRSAKLLNISEFVRKREPLVKFLYGVLFLIFAVVTLISL